MDTKVRVVTHLPIRELWRDDGFSTTTRGKALTHEDMRQLLAMGPVQFVVADVGAALLIPAHEYFHSWRNEAKPHLASGTRASLGEFPGGYCYFAFQWNGREPEAPIVVLEKQH